MREGSELQRWAHARSIHVEPQGRLLGPASALYAIRLEDECEFTSVSAAVIWFGPRHIGVPPDMDATAPPGGDWAHAIIAPTEAADGRWLVTHDLTYPANTLYRGDLVVHGDLWIGTGARIIGSVKASGSIWLARAGAHRRGADCRGRHVRGPRMRHRGPVAAEREIDLGRAARSARWTSAPPWCAGASRVRRDGGLWRGMRPGGRKGRVRWSGGQPTMPRHPMKTLLALLLVIATCVPQPGGAAELVLTDYQRHERGDHTYLMATRAIPTLQQRHCWPRRTRA